MSIAIAETTRLNSSRDNALSALVVLIYAALILVRMPEIVLEGRFWAEEGKFFFVNAWTLEPMRALVTPVGSYLNLVASAATLAARWCVPLEYAPYVTIATSSFFQLCPPLLILLARDRWLQNWPIRIIGLMMLLFVPASDEIWLNTLHSQFELILCCGMILAFDLPSGWRMKLSLFLLVLAPLCGPGAIALLPLFVLRALVERSWGRSLQAFVLAVGSFVQLIGFFKFAASGHGRGSVISPFVFLSVITVKDLAVPFLGLGRAGQIATAIRAEMATGAPPLYSLFAPLGACGVALVLAIRAGSLTAFWLLAGAVVAASSAYYGALDGMAALVHERVGARYAVVPLSLTALCFLAVAANARGREGWIATAICIWLPLIGFQTYMPGWPPVRKGPAWQAQVNRWRMDPSQALTVWPYPWQFRLTADAPGGS